MARHLVRRAVRMTALAATAFVACVSEAAEVVPGEFLVELRPSVATQSKMGIQSTVKTLAQSLDAEVLDQVTDEIVLVRSKDVPSPAVVQNFSAKLQANEAIAAIEPNYVYRISKLPNDREFSETWGLKNSGGYDSAGQRGIAGIDIGAEKAWNITTGSKSVVVAVIDTGIDFSHPDLQSQAWVNLKEKNGKKGVDDDGNGYIDDVNGFNFVKNNGNPFDDQSHGTHCAGTIGARGNDRTGVAGVNWNVSLMALKFMDKKGKGTTAGAIKAIDYARKMGARVLSNSWGGGGKSSLLEKAIKKAGEAGILFVAAAGNNGKDNDKKPNYPSNYATPNMIAVAAIDNRGAVADFSNFGAKTVHIAAPGVNIYSTVPGGGYESYSGTSMATPHVAGVAALVLAKNRLLTVAELRKKLIASARPLMSLKKKVSTGGTINAYSALTGAAALLDPTDPSLLKNRSSYQFSTPHEYREDESIEHRIQVPGASKVAVRFDRFETEEAYDAVSFFDGQGKFVGMMSGKQDQGSFSPIIEGDTIVMKFVSDEQNNAYGFDIDTVVSE